MDDINAFNNQLIAEYRATGGKVSGQFANMPLLLLHTTGAKSGKPRINPLAYSKDGERYIIIASKAGAPTNPDWYYNIVANPAVSLEIGTEQFDARATVAEGAERDRLYAQMAAQMPGFARYQENTTRQIPVVILEPAS